MLNPIPFLPNLRAARDMVERYGLDLSAIDAADHTAFHALLVYLAKRSIATYQTYPNARNVLLDHLSEMIADLEASDAKPR